MKTCSQCQSVMYCMGFDIAIRKDKSVIYAIYQCPTCVHIFNEKLYVGAEEIRSIATALLKDEEEKEEMPP